MARLELRVEKFLKDPIPLPLAHIWTDAWPFGPEDSSWWVGSRHPCAWVIRHPTVSQAQFLVRPGGDGRFFVRNLGTHGTHVDGKHLQGDDEAPLQHRSTIRIGAAYLCAETTSHSDAVIRVRSDSPPGPLEPSPWGSSDEATAGVWGAGGMVEQAKPENQLTSPDALVLQQLRDRELLARGRRAVLRASMNIRWKPTLLLPRAGIECGHGVGFCRGALAGNRLLVAFVDGFGWFHEGAEAVVRYAPDRVPVDGYFAAWQREVEAVLRRGEPSGESGADWCWVCNG